MKILIIADEVWNNQQHGNNVLSNWFNGFPAEFAEIYCSPGIPENNCCTHYFQLTDAMVAKSIFRKKPAGKIVDFNHSSMKPVSNNNVEEANVEFYRFMKSITGEMLRTIREMLWCFGKYDIEMLKKFITDFDPDIVFCARLANHKLLKIEAMVQKVADKPIVAYTGDDEYSLRNIRITPIYWVKKIVLRSKMRKQISTYKLYYTHSLKQAREYHNIFRIPTKVFYKCGVFNLEKVHKELNPVIRMVYIGKTYCNRWKTLAEIGYTLQKINKGSVKITLDIYTRDKISLKQRKELDDGRNIFLRGSLLPEQIQSVYDKADIALHVESFDVKNRLLTKYSFSTKIIDCLASGCAVMAVCWNQQAGFEYLRSQDAAFTAGNRKEIMDVLKKISDKPELVLEYAWKAYLCGSRNHSRQKVQQELLDDFTRIAGEYK